MYLNVLDLGEPSALLLGPDLDVVDHLGEPSALLLGPDLDVVDHPGLPLEEFPRPLLDMGGLRGRLYWLLGLDLYPDVDVL